MVGPAAVWSKGPEGSTAICIECADGSVPSFACGKGQAYVQGKYCGVVLQAPLESAVAGKPTPTREFKWESMDFGTTCPAGQHCEMMETCCGASCCQMMETCCGGACCETGQCTTTKTCCPQGTFASGDACLAKT